MRLQRRARRTDALGEVPGRARMEHRWPGEQLYAAGEQHTFLLGEARKPRGWNASRRQERGHLCGWSRLDPDSELARLPPQRSSAHMSITLFDSFTVDGV